MRELSAAELRENFDHFDNNGDGKLELSEFIALMNVLDAAMSKEDSELGFRAIDEDASGVIEYDEFVQWFGSR